MMQERRAPHDISEDQTLFYLMFEQLASDVPFSEIGMEEIEEIAQMGRVVADVTDDPPRFLTST